MTKVSHLRLIILLCGITLAIGETIKIDSSNTTTANNKSTEKGLFFHNMSIKRLIFIFVTCLT